MYIHSRTVSCRFTCLIILWLLSSHGYHIYFMYHYTSCYSIVSVFFLCTLTRSHLRPWVCMSRYRSPGCTIGWGSGVFWRSSWGAIGLFVTFYLFWLAVCSINVLFLCYSYVVVLYIFIYVLMHSYVFRFWYCMRLCYVLLLHVIYKISAVFFLYYDTCVGLLEA